MKQKIYIIFFTFFTISNSLLAQCKPYFQDYGTLSQSQNAVYIHVADSIATVWNLRYSYTQLNSTADCDKKRSDWIKENDKLLESKYGKGWFSKYKLEVKTNFDKLPKRTLKSFMKNPAELGNGRGS